MSVAVTRAVATVGAAMLAVLLSTGSIAAGVTPSHARLTHSPFFPTLDFRSRGTDVRALQRLLAASGHEVVVDSFLGRETQAALQDFQREHGLRVTGIAARSTWRHIVKPVALGDTGPAVLAVQEELNAKERAGVKVDGDFGAEDADAVRRLQREMGLERTGGVGIRTWSALIWHFEKPDFSTPGLCDYSTINGSEANWGAADAVGYLEAGAQLFYQWTGRRVALGDFSLEYGGPIPGHRSHDRGLDVDLRPIRKDHDECDKSGTFWWGSAYDRKATRLLIHAMRVASHGHIQVVLFDDPVFLRRNVTEYLYGHDDHLHIRFCRADYPNPGWECY